MLWWRCVSGIILALEVLLVEEDSFPDDLNEARGTGRSMLTVLMASHNGSGTLPEVLRAYRGLRQIEGGWQLVIVNNGSTDATHEVIESFRNVLPLTHVFEPRLGKSAALNKGLAHIQGDLIVFTDDDAVPQPEWLIEHRAAADRNPEFSIFAGRIVPQWEVPPEAWLLDFIQDKAGPTFSISDPAWKEGDAPAGHAFGPNMAVRAEVIRMGHRFDCATGPVGSRYRMGEDTKFVQQLADSGLRVWYCKRAVVAHMISKRQMSTEWLLKRARAWGRRAYEDEIGSAGIKPRSLGGIPRYLIREILQQIWRVTASSLSCDSKLALRERWRLHYLVGRALGSRSIHLTHGYEEACSV